MRESFGGAFMIKLVLIFLIIYISFMAVAINYAKAFRIKNQVINILEQSQYKDGDSVQNIDDYLSSVAYYVSDASKRRDCTKDGGKFTDQGVCITPLGAEDQRYYRVTTYISVDFPFFNIHMTLPINGETKVIVY